MMRVEDLAGAASINDYNECVNKNNVSGRQDIETSSHRFSIKIISLFTYRLEQPIFLHLAIQLTRSFSVSMKT